LLEDNEFQLSKVIDMYSSVTNSARTQRNIVVHQKTSNVGKRDTDLHRICKAEALETPADLPVIFNRQQPFLLPGVDLLMLKAI